jgi:uncharacterized protein (DUF1697 family)
MKTYIALLRGINVLGKHSLPMKELVVLLEGIGARRVRTYIQSGNVVFQISEERASPLPACLMDEINRRYGFSPHVLMLGLDAMERAITRNPFPEGEADPNKLHLGFLASTPGSPDLTRLDSLKRASERFQLRDHVFYLHTPDGFGKSRLPANAEKLLGVPMTYRNWRTVCKVRAMASE